MKRNLLQIVIGGSLKKVGALETRIAKLGNVFQFPKGIGSWYLLTGQEADEVRDTLRSELTTEQIASDEIIVQAVDFENSVFPTGVADWMNRTQAAA